MLLFGLEELLFGRWSNQNRIYIVRNSLARNGIRIVRAELLFPGPYNISKISYLSIHSKVYQKYASI
jgi:hypothetical protein